MNEKILEICNKLNRMQITVQEAHEQLLDLFSVSKPLSNDFGKPPKTDAEWDVMCNRIANENK